MLLRLSTCDYGYFFFFFAAGFAFFATFFFAGTCRTPLSSCCGCFLQRISCA